MEEDSDSIEPIKEEGNIQNESVHPDISMMKETKLERAKEQLKKYVDHYIPCLLHLPEKIVGRKIIVYFHANGEDIGLCYNFCATLAQNLSVFYFKTFSNFFF